MDEMLGFISTLSNSQLCDFYDIVLAYDIDFDGLDDFDLVNTIEHQMCIRFYNDNVCAFDS